MYLPVTDKCYWFDAGQFDGVKSLTIRFDTPKNNRLKGVRFAKDFEFGVVVSHGLKMSAS